MVVVQPASQAAAREVSGFALLVGLLMLFAAGKAVLHDTLDPDCFWHLRVAEQLQREGVGPIVDQISFSSIKTPWTPYSWLAELGMKEIWDHAGLRGAIATQAVLQATFILLIVLCCLQRPGRSECDSEPLFPIYLAAVFSAFLAMPFLSFRPVLAAIVLMAVCALLLLRDRRLNERTRAVWIVPILTAITINLHIFAIFIPAWVAALTVGAAIEHKGKLKRYALLLLFCIMGCCATPMLPGTIATIREYATVNPLTSMSMIAEMEPMYRGLDHQICLALVALAVVCAGARRQIRIGEWLWLGGMMLVWVRAGRAAPIFVPILGPVMSWSIPRMSDRALGSRVINIGAAVVMLIGAIRVGLSLPDNNQIDAWLNRRGADLPGYPSAAAEFVQTSVPRATGKLINEFDWGGYLAWKLPSYQVLLDGRTQLYTPKFWQETYLDDQQVTTQMLSAVKADAAVIPMGKSRFRESLQQLGWKRAFSDSRAECSFPLRRSSAEVGEALSDFLKSHRIIRPHEFIAKRAGPR